MIKILVVDDKPSQTELLCLMLAQLGAKCFVAHSGRDAVVVAQNQLPDLIIMDWVMPAESLTGLQAIQAILSNQTTHHIPVIACSALTEVSRAVNVGCVDYLQKPFCVDTLIGKVRQHLN